MKINFRPIIISMTMFTAGVAVIASPLFKVNQNVIAQSSDIESKREILQEQLADLEAEIIEQEKVLEDQKGKTGEYSQEVSRLASEIKKKKQAIASKTREISDLTSEINDRLEALAQLSVDEDQQKTILAQLLRKHYEIDGSSLLEVLLSNKTVSQYYVPSDDIASISASMRLAYLDLLETKELTQQEKLELEEQKTREQNIQAGIEAEEKAAAAQKKEQDQLLSSSKEKEEEVQQIIQKRRQEAARVRVQLFELIDVGPRGGIDFGQAVELANFAANKTGIDPAFLLAILKQETNLGKNLGSCNLPGTPSWQEIMPGPNDNSWRDDQSNFLKITARLGISPEGQPLSCPLASGGWGGAMGPAQFIPTTWEAYQAKTAQLLGKPYADPWITKDAFLASAVYLSELGANQRTFSAERNAAGKYYSGRPCGQANNVFYCDQVMAHKSSIQLDIDILSAGEGL